MLSYLSKISNTEQNFEDDKGELALHGLSIQTHIWVKFAYDELDANKTLLSRADKKLIRTQLIPNQIR